jgi:hypothetical protein
MAAIRSLTAIPPFDLVGLALLLEHFEDLVFGDLHGVPFDSDLGVR